MLASISVVIGEGGSGGAIALATIVGGKRVSMRQPDLRVYARDMWPRLLLQKRQGGALEHFPQAVVWPENEREVASIVRLAREMRLAIIPYGGGSGVCGGTVPLRGGITIDMKRMDAIESINREELVTDMASTIGPERNLLKPEPESCRQIKIKYPIIHNDHVAKLRHLPPNAPFRSTTLSMLFDLPDVGPGESGQATCGAALEQAMADLCRRASEAVAAGFDVLILSDRGVGPRLAPIPSLLATAGVHHHLVREGSRTRCALVVECGDAREVHHVALLLGYGAGVVNPYVAIETIDDMIRQGMLTGITRDEAIARMRLALESLFVEGRSTTGVVQIGGSRVVRVAKPASTINGDGQ